MYKQTVLGGIKDSLRQLYYTALTLYATCLVYILTNRYTSLIVHKQFPTIVSF